MITMDSPLVEFVKKAFALPCLQLERIEDKIITTTKNDSNESLGEDFEVQTTSGMVELFEKHPEFTVRMNRKNLTKMNRFEILGILQGMGKELDQELRSFLISLITIEMDAFQYYLKADYLTKVDDLQLEAIFDGKLPEAQRELDEGILKRVKDD